MRKLRSLVLIGLASALVLSGCSSGERSAADEGTGAPIPQPRLSNPALAPDSRRVDMVVPTFSNPTRVTNPLFPVSSQGSVLMLGEVDGKPFRTEVTLLPYTRIVDWGGQRIETLVSQYVAYLDGRIQEVAYDLYAQADDGGVWYFGEDVSDFVDGVITTKQGTWTAAKDGPAAMIMPGRPKVGNVYRAENMPGIAFEEVSVKAVGVTLDGPFGPVAGGVVGEEFHYSGGGTELKQFAPGYGEFLTAGGGDVEALALAVPTDAASGPAPPELGVLAGAADDIYAATGSKRWDASAAVQTMRAAWARYEQAGSRGWSGPRWPPRSLDSTPRHALTTLRRRERRRSRSPNRRWICSCAIVRCLRSIWRAFDSGSRAC